MFQIFSVALRMPLSDHTGSLLPLALPLSLEEMSKYRYTETGSIIMIYSFPASDDLSSAGNLCKQFGPRSGPT